ncbi:MAG: hypothetical protein OEZ52_13660 [Candidatus Aminicenantes bacterium]|nr:hypothetical protein [Candidatus Aminicenantes bacterium]
MVNKDYYKKVFRTIDEKEMRQWKAAPKSLTTKLFEDFLLSDDGMVEVNIDILPNPKPRSSSEVKSTKQDSFASSFYAWKRKRKSYLKSLGIDVLLIRRGEKVALKKSNKKRIKNE